MTRILFLDVDGCLNQHDRHPNGYCGLHRDKLDLLDHVVRETGCRIVLASSWRYLLLSNSMTLEGFRNLLLTHGASPGVAKALLDYLPPDRDTNDLHDRGKLARQWLDGYRFRRTPDDPLRPLNPESVCALDDGSWPEGFDLGYEANGIPSVRPVPTVGLTVELAERVIELLGRVA